MWYKDVIVSFSHPNMISILNYIEEKPQETQRLIGLGYSELQKLMENAVETSHRAAFIVFGDV